MSQYHVRFQRRKRVNDKNLMVKKLQKKIFGAIRSLKIGSEVFARKFDLS